ncbi:hypothetical protein PAXINDRAFT_170672, partial [Paxillus involutus ATCC 200175]
MLILSVNAPRQEASVPGDEHDGAPGPANETQVKELRCGALCVICTDSPTTVHSFRIFFVTVPPQNISQCGIFLEGTKFCPKVPQNTIASPDENEEPPPRFPGQPSLG